MAPPDVMPPIPDARLTGTAHEFTVFCTGERQRRSNTEDAFNGGLFDEAMAYIVSKFTVQEQEAGA